MPDTTSKGVGEKKEKQTDKTAPKKGPGRKTGSTNKEVKGKESVPRKGASEYKHPDKAIKRKADELNKIIDAENQRARERGEEPQYSKVSTSDSHADGTPRYSESMCEGMVGGMLEMFAGVMGVPDAKPDPKDVKMFAQGLSNASIYWDVLHPKYFALGMAGMGAFKCVKPIHVARKAKLLESGETKKKSTKKPAIKIKGKSTKTTPTTEPKTPATEAK